ncbi:MAG TPA: phage minor head protein [Candidatus Acidoferrales bacterium]|nr:phage minor head protein [Candidatus Acidoferrales bacterium]
MAATVLETDFEPLPFDDAVNYFRDLTNVTPAQFAELGRAARAKAFTIAGGATRQVRASIKDLIDQALSEGLTLREFQAEAPEILDAAGISERTPWYWETVYRTNLSTSYQVGRWRQMTDPDVVAERPFLRYVSARLPNSRPSHVEKHGLIYPVDHEFWQEWYPPNGFNCYCTAMSVSESMLNRNGWRVSTRRVTDEPDPGFAVNAGMADAV